MDTLIEHMLKEITIDVDPNDPSAVSDAKAAVQRAKQNPQRAAREENVKAKNSLRDAQKSDGPTKSIDIKIAKLKQQLSSLQTQRSSIKKRTTSESVNYPVDVCEVVYTDEDDNILHEGSTLSESAIQAFKRNGNVIKRQFRCTSGKKMGSVVANPNDCNKRKNPKLVKAGKISSRKNKAIRISKSRVSKNKSISKMVSSLNKRLKVK